MTIRRRSSKTVYENAWMSVREDEIERADGTQGIFGVVEKPDFALIIPQDADGDFCGCSIDSSLWAAGGGRHR
jgi:hypothetical protein